jgi:hypothetical protein
MESCAAAGSAAAPRRTAAAAPMVSFLLNDILVPPELTRPRGRRVHKLDGSFIRSAAVGRL